jgi:hypothetical protein
MEKYTSKRCGRIRMGFYFLGTFSLILNLILLWFARTFWKEVDLTLQDASGLNWPWVVIILVITIILILNYTLKLLNCFLKFVNEGNTAAGIMQVVFVIPILVIWNTMSLVLILEAGDGVIVSQAQYYSEMCAPWFFLFISFWVFCGLVKKKNSELKVRLMLAILSVVFLGLAVNSFTDL